MRKQNLWLITALLVSGCATARPLPVAECPAPPTLPFTYSMDAKSSDIIVTPANMNEGPIFRWNTTSQAALFIYPPEGVAQGMGGSLKVGRFKKEEAEAPAAAPAPAQPATK